MNIAAAVNYSTLTSPSEAVALSKLPPAAQKKFDHLRALEMRANALRSGLYEAYNVARENYGNAQRDLLKFDRQYGATVTVIKEGKRIEEEQTGRAPLRLEVERLKAEVARIAAEQKATNIGVSTSDIVGFLASTNSTFIAVPIPKVTLDKGQSLSDGLAAIRSKQSEVRDEIVSVENAPSPPQECKEAMRRQIAAIAETGQPDISGLTHGLPIAFPTEILTASGHVPAATTVAANVKNAFAFSVWLHQEALIRKLSEMIDAAAEATDAVPLNAIDRGAKLIALNKSLLSLQRSEEAIISKIEEQGGTVARTCRDPVVLLGIETKI